MEHRLNDIIGNSIRATDGDLGKIVEFYFDDTTWIIRYMVVETGTWLDARKVLISLAAIGKPDWKKKMLTVNLTCEQVKNSPNIDTQMPVSRQHETELHAYYLWPHYWESSFGGGIGMEPPLPASPPLIRRTDSTPASEPDRHLRSTHELTGYHLQATDGEIGTISDFIIDDKDWSFRHLIVDTGKWLPGKRVLIPSDWIKGVNWADANVFLNQPKKSVKDSPVFAP